MFSANQHKDVKTILLLNQWIISVDYQQKFYMVFMIKFLGIITEKALFWLSQSQTKAQKHQGDTA